MTEISKGYILLILSLYISQFAGYGFFFDAFISILRNKGIGLENLGLIYMLGFFIILKFLWAPFVDKIHFGSFGHYKGWLIITQLLICTFLILIGFIAIEDSLKLILICIVFFSLTSSFQYVALDGFIYKTISKKKRSVGNAIKMAGGMIGAILGGGVGLMFYEHLGWQNTIFIFVGLAMISMFLLLFFDEVENKNKEDLKSIKLRDIFGYWAEKKRRIWLYLVILSPIAISTSFGLTSRILVDKHWELEKIGLIMGIVGYSVGAIMSFFVPYFISKFSKKIVLFVGILGQSMGLSFLLFVLNGYSDMLFVSIIVSFTYLFYPFVTTVMATIMMDNITSSTPAFEYSIQQSLNAFVGMFITGFSMFLAGFIGYENVIYMGVVLGLFALIPAWKMEMS